MHELAPNLFEADLQRAVDFGHSISPALEARSHYALTHGEAVAIDMLLATAIAVQRYICPQSLFDRLVHVYSAAGLPMNSALCTPQMLRAALDEARRHRGGTLNFVVPRAIGACAFLQHVEDWELRDALHSVQRVANGVYAST